MFRWYFNKVIDNIIIIVVTVTVFNVEFEKSSDDYTVCDIQYGYKYNNLCL